MYMENRKPVCCVCGKNPPVCGDPKIYCLECAEALRASRSNNFVHPRDRTLHPEENYNGDSMDSIWSNGFPFDRK